MAFLRIWSAVLVQAKGTEFGATHTIDASDGDWVEQVKALTGGLGVDYGFWAVSTPATIRQTFDATRASRP